MDVKRWGILGLCALAVLFLWALYVHETHQLCNGYKLIWMNGAEAVIADPDNNVVTSGTVTRFAANCPFITGYTGKQGFPPDTNPREGFFLINTDTGSHQIGMTESEWRKELLTIRWQTPHMYETHPTHPKLAN
jgi:hypothetical protein